MSKRVFRFSIDGGVYPWYNIQVRRLFWWSTMVKFTTPEPAKLALEILRAEENLLAKGQDDE